MKWITLSTCALLAAALAASAGAPAAHAKKKLRDAFKPAPGAKTPPASTATPGGKPVQVKVPPPAGSSTRDTTTRGTPAPAVPPGGRTTIAPFPVPGDTGRDAAERRKLLNVPKPGGTTLVIAPGAETHGAMVTAPPPADTGALPRFGDFVYVEELPEAITRVAPTYPEAAHRAGVDGIVMVQALVARDGSVVDARIVKSIPALDEAAVAAVRQWRFKPAMTKGNPVAVWVGIPVKFSLH